MNTAAALAQDLPELKDVMFAIESCRETVVTEEQAPSVSLLSTAQRRHLRSDSRVGAWVPAHLLASLRE